MRAIMLEPGKAESAGLEEIGEPPESDGPVLVETLAMGVCGTDAEIVAGEYGWPPPGHRRLVLGHESLGRVVAAPDGGPVSPGDLVAGIVRRPDPEPCACCARGEWDMCQNGRYTERGIKERDGFGSERWRAHPESLVKVDAALSEVGVLLEPTSVVAKAWDHIERIGHRACWEPHSVLVTGAGPIGLLAAMLAVQRGYEVHVLDRATEGPKPELVADLGAGYHTESLKDACSAPDIVIECTGAAQLVFDAMDSTAPGGIVCLTGVSSGGRTLAVDAGLLHRTMVLHNTVVFGSVNANRRHYEAAATALAQADKGWLGRLVTRRVPLNQWHEALEHRDDDVKVVVDFTA